jgi:hypothetical protein
VLSVPEHTCAEAAGFAPALAPAIAKTNAAAAVNDKPRPSFIFAALQELILPAPPDQDEREL